MFIPLDDPEVDSLYTSGELKTLKEQERRQAKERAYQGLKVREIFKMSEDEMEWSGANCE
jgi:hypothetical protein